MPNKKEDLAKNALIIGFGSLSVQLVSFLLLPFYTSHLTTKDFGVVDLIITYTILFIPVVTLELRMASFRFLIDVRNDQKAQTRIITNVLQTASLVLFMLAGLFIVVTHYVHIEYANLALLSIGTAVFPALFMQIARGFGRIKVFAMSSIIGGCVAIVLNVVLIAQFHMGAKGMLIGAIAANIVSSLYLFLYLKLYKYIDPKSSDKALRREMLGYSLPLIPNAVSWWAINAADRTIIAAFLGVSSNGIYAVAYKFPTVFTLIFSFFSMSWTESASMHINSKDRDKFFSEVMTASVKFFGSLACVMVACMPFVFEVLIDKKYREAYLYIPILISASFLGALVGMYGAIYIAKKMTRQIANTTVVSGVINIVMSLALIKFIGMYGTAIAAAVAYLVMAVYRHYDSKKYVAITYEKNLFVKMALIYAFTTCLYYYNSTVWNIANLLVVTIIAIVLNRSIIGVIKNKILIKLGKLSPEQETLITGS